MSAERPRTLIVVRHAHRDRPPGRDRDNGLSPKGEKQSRRVLKLFKERFGEEKGTAPLILSSPKIRCMETLVPIARWTEAPVRVTPLLDEGGDVDAKVARFLTEWRAGKGALTVLCSHGDVIPVLLQAATGARADLSKGGWAEIEFDGGPPMLTWLVQEP